MHNHSWSEDKRMNSHYGPLIPWDTRQWYYVNEISSEWWCNTSVPLAGHLLCDITRNWIRHLCCFGPVSECSLLVVDVSESWLEVAANNSRLSRHNVNYISAELAQNVNSQPRHWAIHTCCKHEKHSVSEMPSKSALNL